MKEEKKRIAFLGCGVLEIPCYVDLLNELSKEFEITLFAEYFHDHHQSKNFTIKKVSRVKLPRRLRELNFLFMVLVNLALKKHHIIHCQSTFPAGFCGLIVGKLLQKKVIVGLDAAELSMVKDINFGDLLNTKRSELNKFVIKNADVVTTLSKFHDNEIQNNLGHKRETIIVPCRIRRSKFPARKKNRRERNYLNQCCLFTSGKGSGNVIKCNKISGGENTMQTNSDWKRLLERAYSKPCP